MNYDRVKEQLKRHEGYRQNVYPDTVGVMTVAHGRNLQAKGITPAEADHLLENDIFEAYGRLKDKLPFFEDLDEIRQEVLVNMTVNIGIGGVMKFVKMLTAFQVENYDVVADEMLDSKWARQVGDRSVELATQMRKG